MRSLPLLLLAATALVPACTPRKAHVAPPVSPEPPPTEVVDPAAAQDPTRLEPVELEVSTELSNRTVVAQRAGEVFARIEVRAPAPGDSPRPRANVGLVVDTSASMRGDAIARAREAALTLLEGLSEGDVLCVVAFGSAVEVLVPATALDEGSRPRIRAAIEGMEATGTTDLAGGLQAGLQQVQGGARPDQINRLVLLSDGVPNDETPIVNLAQVARNSGVSITALGLGLEYHETLLGQLAQVSGGKFHFIEEPAEVAAVFRDEVLSIEQLAARSLSVTLTPGPGVSIVDVPGLSVGRSGRQAVVGLPDLAQGKTLQLVVKLAVGEHRDGATVELLDGVVGYVDARTGQGQQQRTFVAATATADAAEHEAGMNLPVAVAAARATTAAATLHIVSLARSGQVDEARRTLDQTVAQAKALSKKMPDSELARLVDDLVELRPTLPGLAPPPPPKVAKQPTPLPGHRPAPSGSTRAEPLVDAGNVGLSATGARSVRATHERAYRTLNGG
ncbi:MAG: VWA domain-containing protein [Nannocystaceae bacterium]